MLVTQMLSQLRGILCDQNEAEILLSFVLRKSRVFLITHPGLKMSFHTQKKIRALAMKRARGAPIAYLTHHKEFYCLDFYVDARVMIPRPETEMLVSEALCKTSNVKRRMSICDIGTGSGCIAIALANALPKARITAVDISSSALVVARKNAKTNEVVSRIQFLRSDLLSAVLDRRFDMLVANLPYVGISENHLVSREVSEFEPREAIFGGDTGLELFERLFQQITLLKFTPKLLIAEMGFLQKTGLAALIKKYFGNRKVVWKNDLADLPRCFILHL